MIFISYSHEDEPFFLEFEKHLRPWQELDVWSDKRILASQDWENEIQEAIKRARIAILLTSIDFLNSTYIQERELPPLFRAKSQRRVAVTALYLRRCNIEDFRFNVDGQRLSLTDTQGLNSPDMPVCEVDKSERDKIYVGALRRLQELKDALDHSWRDPNVEPVPTASFGPRLKHAPDRREVTIQLEAEGGDLLRSFTVDHERRASSHDRWPPLRLQLSQILNGRSSLADSPLVGDLLYHVALGDESSQQRVLSCVFRTDSRESQSPLRHPVRVRIISNEPLLQRLPWALTSSGGHSLLDHGWTFEQILPEYAVLHDLPLGFLRTPGAVLIIASTDDLRNEAFAGEMFRSFNRYWRSAYPALTASCREEIRDHFANVEVALLCFFGSAVSEDGRLSLRLGTEKDPGERLTPGELSQLMGSQRPRLTLLALIESAPAPPGGSLQPLASAGSAAIGFSSRDALNAADWSVSWLRRFLEEGEAADPVVTAHEILPPTLTVYSGYRRWQTSASNAPAREELARILLDRKHLRAHARHIVDGLARDRERRLCCALIYGSLGNHVELAATQIFEHLKVFARDLVVVTNEKLQLPEEESFSAKDVEETLRRHLSLGPRDHIGAAVAKNGPAKIGERVPLLLLDWGTRGGERGSLAFSSILAWQAFNRDRLLPLCSERDRHLRVLSTLSLELPPKAHARLRQRMEEVLHQDSPQAHGFHFELLEPLDKVGQKDLMDYLRAREDFPDRQYASHARLINQASKGHFDEACRWLEKGQRLGWIRVRRELEDLYGGRSTDNRADEEDFIL